MELSQNAQIINDNIIASWNIYTNTDLTTYAYLQNLAEYEKGIKFVKENYLISDKELEYLTEKLETLMKQTMDAYRKKVGIK